jgi:RecB family endonuclease NucS
VSDIKLFRVSVGKVDELAGTTDAIEKSVQTFFEKNLEALLGVRFLASEFVTSNGRIDTLGLDENGTPVILEYKRASNENVVNQGLFYLDWLMDHRKDFQWLVLEKFGKEDARLLRTLPSTGRAIKARCRSGGSGLARCCVASV